jgi:hypothetical protein
MGVNILEVSSKFLNEWKNDINFSTNTGDFNINLAASVMEIVRTVKEFDISWNSVSKLTASTWTVNTTTGLLTSTTGNFMQDGFAVGDEFVYEDLAAAAGVNFTGRIVSINPTTIVFTLLTGSRINVDTDAIIYGLEPQTAMIWGFGLLSGTENFNILSKVSNNSQEYYGSNIGFDTGGGVRDTNPVVLTRKGIPQDWVTGQIQARFVGNPAGATAHNDVQRFEVIHTFMVVPFYLDGELANLQNITPPSLLGGGNSLKYAYSPGLRSALTVPLSEKSVQYALNLGSVAWFNENFNGFQNGYEIVSIAYEEAITTATASGILIGSETRIKIVVNRLVGVFAGGERFGVYISQLPDQAEYTNTNFSDLKSNFIYDNVLQNVSALGVTGQDFINDCTAIVNSGNLEITLTMEYSGTQKAFLSQKFASQPTHFMIGVQVGDITIPSPNSDKVMLLADTQLYDQSPDISDLMHVTKFDLYPHNQQIGVGTGFTDLTGWVEDGIAIDFEFDVDLTKSAFINSLQFNLEIYNPITNQRWIVDSYSFSPANAVVSGGVQQIFENTTRGYILRAGDQFNDVIINVGSQALGIQKYTGRFGQKMSWQEWVANLNVDTIFFNPLEPLNNLNNKVSNYSVLNGYEVRMSIFANVDGVSPLGVSGNTDYLFLSPNIKIYDYEEDGNVIPIWSCVIETWDVAGNVNLGGAILTGQDTLFRVTWTNSTGPLALLGNIYGINRIEETLQPAYAKTEMSSINLPIPSPNQLLKPSVGTLLDITLVGGLVVMECLIDGNVAQSGINYNLSSRIHDPAITINPDDKITEQGVLKDTEASVQKIVE